MFNNLYKKIIVHGQKIYVVWNQIPTYEKMTTFFQRWEEQILKEIDIISFHYIPFDSEVAYNVATGNYLIDDSTKFCLTLDQLISSLSALKSDKS